MSISAHSSEKILLNYIDKDSLDFALQIEYFYTLQALREKKEPQLNVIKTPLHKIIQTDDKYSKGFCYMHTRIIAYSLANCAF